jgi:hypothetical protein
VQKWGALASTFLPIACEIERFGVDGGMVANLSVFPFT